MRVQVVDGRFQLGKSKRHDHFIVPGIPERECDRCGGDKSVEYANGIGRCRTCRGVGRLPARAPQRVAFSAMRTFTYDAPESVKIGDYLVLPANDFMPERIGTVVRLRSRYTGSVRRAQILNDNYMGVA